MESKYLSYMKMDKEKLTNVQIKTYMKKIKLSNAM